MCLENHRRSASQAAGFAAGAQRICSYPSQMTEHSGMHQEKICFPPIHIPEHCLKAEGSTTTAHLAYEPDASRSGHVGMSVFMKVFREGSSTAASNFRSCSDQHWSREWSPKNLAWMCMAVDPVGWCGRWDGHLRETCERLPRTIAGLTKPRMWLAILNSHRLALENSTFC